MLDEGYERSSLTEVEAVLDSLSPATSEQVYSQTLGMSPRAVAAVAASRADAAGGGAEFPDEWTVDTDTGTLTITSGTNDPAIVLNGPGGGVSQLIVGPRDQSEPNLTLWAGSNFSQLYMDGVSNGNLFVATTLTADPALLVMRNFAPIFRIDNNGSVHIKTGTSIVADL